MLNNTIPDHAMDLDRTSHHPVPLPGHTLVRLLRDADCGAEAA